MIISVWGNSGSGVSTLAMKLALEFSHKNKNTVIVDSNFIAPQTKIWFPTKDFPADVSLSTILSNNIEMDKVASKITMIDDYLGVLGYGRGLSINAISSRDDTPSELLSVLNNLCDVVIVDCQSNITQDVMSFMAVDTSTVKIINMTPDLRGLAWYEANVMMLKDKWASQHSEVIKVFNKINLNAPVDAIEKVIGTGDFFLPFSYEIEEELYNGTIANKGYKGTGKKYGTVINSLYTYLTEYKPTISGFGAFEENPSNIVINENITENINPENTNNITINFDEEV